MKSFVWGFTQYFQGVRYSLFQKTLRLHLFVLALCDLVFFCLIISSLVSHMDVFLKSHITSTGFYYYVAYILALIATFIVSAFVTYFFNNFFVGIFYGDVLSKRYFAMQNFIVTPPIRSFWQQSKHLTEKFAKILVIFALTVFSFFLALIPGAGLVGLLLGSLVLSFDMMDYGFDVMGLTIKERLAFFASNFFSLLGFSFGLAVVMAFPVVNVVLMPSSVVAASHLLVEIKKGRK